jgi:hypothetical protein
VEQNVQVCEAVIRFPSKTTVAYRNFPEDLFPLREHLLTLVLFARNNKKLRKANTFLPLTDDKFSGEVRCIAKDTYSVCFHAKA